MDNVYAYCLADQELVLIVNPHVVENREHPAVHGTCEKCGKPVYKVLSTPAREIHETQ
ncbi:Hypothetical protein PACV_253 [Pacmanvirus A23]|uniref:Hypothetical protein n=1 Tax=Pacmanvirus A23 TaxID=1932881 RepID=UPI000A096463|nr:Hypothetical protein B9W72_gp251 [Pacmanvirus A23]SIP85968.1 Hypothetical protein PACV_253 [Pacmanvirus A23]